MKTISNLCTFLIFLVVAIGFTKYMTALNAFFFAVIFFVIGIVVNKLDENK